MNIKNITLLFVFALFSLSANSKQNDGSVNHYKLDYDSVENKLTASACADEGCSSFYKDKKTKLHLTESNGNQGLEVKFHYLENGYQIVDYVIAKGQCVSLMKQASGNSTNPDAPLSCFIDGVEAPNCKICSQTEPSSSLLAYVYESLDLKSALPQAISGYSYTVGDIKYYGENTNRILTDKANGNLLGKGDSITFPPVVSYNKAEKIELTIKGDNGKKNKKKEEVEYKLDLVFVPKQLRWSTTSECIGDKGFEYNKHADSCNVLGKAGEKIPLNLQVLGYDDQPVKGYAPTLNAIQINILNDKSGVTDTMGPWSEKLNQNDESGKSDFESDKVISRVAIIQAHVPNHCAPYALNENDCLLETEGDTAIIGRTVPDLLRVKEATAGDIKGNVVYAGKPGVSFETAPSFTVVGLDTQGTELPSYSGEFAGGLKNNSELTLDSSLSKSELLLKHSELDSSSGQHRIELDPSILKFIKNTPFAETGLNFPLQLIIKDHDTTQGVSETTPDSTVKLANIDDKLRFGYLALEDTELPVETDGHIKGKLYYLDQFKKSKLVTENHFSFASDIANDANIAATPKESESAIVPVLAVDNDGIGTDGIGVAGYKQAAEFDVELTVDEWLQPHHDGSGLVQPTAQLKFTADPRKRGNDSTFNRREVIR